MITAALQDLGAGIQDDFLVINDQYFRFGFHLSYQCSTLQGKAERESRAFLQFTFDRYIAVMFLHNSITDCQAKTYPMPGFFGRKERVENLLHILFRDAVTGILHLISTVLSSWL